MRNLHRSLALALSCALLPGALACGKDNGTQPPPDAGGQAAYGLALVGNAVVRLHPGDVANLSVVLAQAEVGPVAGGKIHFEFTDGDPAGAKLDNTDATTATDGTAGFKLTAGAKGDYKILATSTDHPEVKPVAFAIDVLPVQAALWIVASPQVQVTQDLLSAKVTMYISSSVGLKVHLLDKDSGDPIAGQTILFALGPASAKAAFSGASAKTASAVTSAGGDAQVFLVSSNVTESLQITAVTQTGGVGGVTFGVDVQSNGTGSGCTSSQQCPAGQVCNNGVCGTGTNGSCTIGSDHQCPFGYECINGQCVPPDNPQCDPNNPNCPSNQTCKCTGSPPAQVCQCVDICPVCTAGTHCDPSTGTCVPNGVNTPDISGVWYTKHTYSLVQALPNVLQQVAKIVRVIDQLIHGTFFTGIWSWLNPIIAGIIQQYVPTWVTTIIEILDDIATIFSNLRSEGSMRVLPGADSTHYKATEVWTSLVFYFLPLCPNGPPAGDPAVPPDCARFDVATSDSDNPGSVGQCKGQQIPAISVQVAPFTANVSGVTAGTPPVLGPPWTANFDQRQVKLQFGKVILVAINLLLSYLTQYNCIEEALDCSQGNPCLIDCVAFGQSIEQLTGGLIQAATAEAICDGLATTAGKLITDLLAGITFDTDALDFKGHSSISKIGDPNIDPSVCASQNMCAGQLGLPDFDLKLQKDPTHRDGWWEGSFFSFLKGMPGAFEAARDPITQ